MKNMEVKAKKLDNLLPTLFFYKMNKYYPQGSCIIYYDYQGLCSKII